MCCVLPEQGTYAHYTRCAVRLPSKATPPCRPDRYGIRAILMTHGFGIEKFLLGMPDRTPPPCYKLIELTRSKLSSVWHWHKTWIVSHIAILGWAVFFNTDDVKNLEPMRKTRWLCETLAGQTWNHLRRFSNLYNLIQAECHSHCNCSTLIQVHCGVPSSFSTYSVFVVQTNVDFTARLQ